MALLPRRNRLTQRSDTNCFRPRDARYPPAIPGLPWFVRESALGRPPPPDRGMKVSQSPPLKCAAPRSTRPGSRSRMCRSGSKGARMQRVYRDYFEIVCYPEEASDGWRGLALVFDVEKFEDAPDDADPR